MSKEKKIRVFVVLTFQLKETESKKLKKTTQAVLKENGQELVAIIPEKVAGWAGRQFATIGTK